MKTILETIKLAVVLGILSFGVLVIISLSSSRSPNTRGIEQ